MYYSHRITTSLGPLTLYATQKGLAAIIYREQEALSPAKADASRLAPYAKSILAYLSGERAGDALAQLPLDLQWGTAFERRVWQEIHRIPVGKTISYSDLALRAGNPKAVRAVGTACGKNPIPLVIPCHRVLAKDGGLGGFTWGVDVKQKLLALEGVQRQKAA